MPLRKERIASPFEVNPKKTVNKPCPECNTLIKKENYLGGSIYFCEKCQRM
jgi:formamidopyrimidine-DNA glycosylase